MLKGLGSRRSSTASRDGRGKSLTRSKSPFRSFRWKKTRPDTQSTGNASDAEEDQFGRTVGRWRGASMTWGDGGGSADCWWWHGMADFPFRTLVLADYHLGACGGGGLLIHWISGGGF